MNNVPNSTKPSDDEASTSAPGSSCGQKWWDLGVCLKIFISSLFIQSSLQGPDAAPGDSFIKATLRPFAAVIGVLLALNQSSLAPAAFLLLYNPSHLWIRVGGFVKGYCQGAKSVDFIRSLNLPLVTRRIHFISVVSLGMLAAVVSRFFPPSSLGLAVFLVAKAFFLILVLLCYWGIKRGISQLRLFYSLFFVSWILSL